MSAINKGFENRAFIGASPGSSIGQSIGLLLRGLQVRVLFGRPKFRRNKMKNTSGVSRDYATMTRTWFSLKTVIWFASGDKADQNGIERNKVEFLILKWWCGLHGYEMPGGENNES